MWLHDIANDYASKLYTLRWLIFLLCESQLKKILKKSFPKWPSEKLSKFSPHKATIKLDKNAKNNHFRTLKIDHRYTKMM